MAEIDVTTLVEGRFRVEVREGGSSTTHEVTASPDAIARYGGAEDSADLIRRSFEFLLKREPKESILRSFELSVIERYFPEYPKVIRRG